MAASIFLGRLLMLRFLFLTLCFSTSAQAFSIDNRNVVFYNDERSVEVKIENTSDEKKQFIVRSSDWKVTNPDDAKLIAFPPVFQLEAGQTQSVRLLLKNSKDAGTEQFYRLNIEESDFEDISSSRFATRVSFSFPVFYVNKKFLGDNKVEIIKKGDRLRLENRSNFFMHTTGIRYATGEYSDFFHYLLPDYGITFDISPEQLPATIVVKGGNNIIIKEDALTAIP